MRGRRLAAAASLLPLVIGSCELAEVAAPDSADLLVVDGVLRVGSERQYLLLHRTLEGQVVRGEPGASVSVFRPDGSRVDYVEEGVDACVFAALGQWEEGGAEIEPSCYMSPRDETFFVEAGETYELLVETQRGEVARGRTVVPNAHEFREPAVQVDPRIRLASCTLPTDPFTLTWTRAEGAWSYVITLEISGWGDELREQGVEVPDPLELTSVSVSEADTSLAFPGNLGLFQRTELDQRLLALLQQGLPEDADALLVVLAGDPNYTNAIRGGRFNPSGNVRVSSIVGDAVGLFGSVVPLSIRSLAAVPTTAPDPCPRGAAEAA